MPDSPPPSKKSRVSNPYGVDGLDVEAYRPPPPPGPAPRAAFATQPAGVTCHECGYDLAGIATDAPCPECGAARRRPNAALPVLSETPIWYIRLVQLGFLGTTFGALYPFGAAIYDAAHPWWFAGLPMAPVWGRIVASALWCGGLWLVSKPPPHISQRESRTPKERVLPSVTLRMIAVGSQSAWVLAGGLLTLHAASAGAGSAGALYWVAFAFGVIGLAGIVPTALLLARVADFTADTALATRLRNAVWGMCASITVIVLARVLPTAYGGGVFRTIVGLFWLWLAFALIVFLISNVALLRLCTLAVGHARAAEARALRIAEKARQELLEARKQRSVGVDADPPSLYHYVGTKPHDSSPDRAKPR